MLLLRNPSGAFFAAELIKEAAVSLAAKDGNRSVRENHRHFSLLMV